MASLSHIQTFHSLYSNKLFSPQSTPLKLHHPQKISACSIKKPRASRKAKSNLELCNDIREFLSVVGLPEDYVPSLKELSQHGRQDLANVVRRRGYKVIREFLTSPGSRMNMSDVKDGVTEKHEEIHGQNEKVIDLADDVSISSHTATTENQIKDAEMDRMLSSDPGTVVDTESDSLFQEKVTSFMPNGTVHSVQQEKMIDLSDGVSLSSNTATMESTISSTEVGTKLNSDDQSCISPEASLYSSLQEKAAKFIQNGQLGEVEDSYFVTISESSSEETEYTELKNAEESEYDSTNRESEDHSVYSANGAERENDKLSSQLVEDTASRNPPLSTNGFTTEDLDVEIQNVEQQADINRLKFMLHQKELELTQLKQEIEREKLALSALQTKAEEEISKAQKLISEKDADLHVAEESLSGLKEVVIEYCGDGEIVEIAGSFNGWHHKIKMDPVQSSNFLDSAGPRKSRLWRTDLWLYPGLYEIKFIVDGQWKVDPQRESVISGNVHNNILRVDR